MQDDVGLLIRVGRAKELTNAIRAFIAGWNQRCHPFTWAKTADEILVARHP